MKRLGQTVSIREFHDLLRRKALEFEKWYFSTTPIEKYPMDLPPGKWWKLYLKWLKDNQEPDEESWTRNWTCGFCVENLHERCEHWDGNRCVCKTAGHKK